MSKLTPQERLELCEFLRGKGFEFEKRKLRRPGSREIIEIHVGTRVLDKAAFGMTVIGIDLDAEKDMWFVAPSWEASQLSSTKIHEIRDDNLKLAAAAFVSGIKDEIQKSGDHTFTPAVPASVPAREPEPKNEFEQKSESEPKNEPEQKSESEAYEQLIKNVSQAKVSLTKNTKGYNWEISAYADNLNEAIDQAIAADQRLRDRFGMGV